MQIEIETRDIRVAFDILGFTPGRAYFRHFGISTGGATLTFQGLIEHRALDVPGVLQFIKSIAPLTSKLVFSELGCMKS